MDKIRVNISFLSTMKQYNKGTGETTIYVSPHATVRDVLEMFDLPEKLEKIVLVNGRKADINSIAGDGDKLTVFSPVEGG